MIRMTAVAASGPPIASRPRSAAVCSGTVWCSPNPLKRRHSASRPAPRQPADGVRLRRRGRHTRRGRRPGWRGQARCRQGRAPQHLRVQGRSPRPVSPETRQRRKSRAGDRATWLDHAAKPRTSENDYPRATPENPLDTRTGLALRY
jgi:hypothetical protein